MGKVVNHIGIPVCVLILAASAFAEQNANASSKPPTLTYVIRVADPAAQKAEIEVSLQGLSADQKKLGLSMSRGFAFAQLPAPLIDGDIRAKAGGQEATLKIDSPFHWTLDTNGAATVELRYAVALTHRERPEVKGRDDYEFPYVAVDHGMLVTAALLMTPDEVDTSPEIRIETPTGWAIVAPWTEKSPGVFQADTIGAAAHDLVAIGAWQRKDVKIDDFVATIAFAPGQNGLAEAVEPQVQKIVEHELALFGVPAKGRYLFLFGRPDGNGLGGSPKTRSMTLFVEPRLLAHLGDHLSHLIAHEFFHTWSVDRAPFGGDLRWVGEGFTDYYAFLVSARVGLIDANAFASTLSEKMQALDGNALREKTSLADAGGSLFFSDRSAYSLIYDGGLLVAAYLDCALRRLPGKSLDELLRGYINDPKWRSGAQPSLASFLEHIGSYGNEAIRKRVEQLVTTPYAIDAVALFAEIGVTIEKQTQKASLRMRANFDGARVTAIDPKDAAARLGVQSGDAFVKINGRDVANASEIMSAWAAPQDDRIRATLKRGDATVQIDEPIPMVTVYIVPSSAWADSLKENPKARVAKNSSNTP